MNSLFTRVFVSFWIVLGIIIAGCVATTTMVAWHRITVLSGINFEQMNRDAGSVLREKGEAGLKSWLSEVGSAYPGVDIYVLNQMGKDLLDRPVPTRLAQWLARGNGQKLIVGAPNGSPLAPSFQYAANHLLDSSQISAGNGENFTLAVAWFGSSPIDVLGSYDVVPGLLLLAIIVSAGASWWLARYISAPIYGLQQSARILARGDLDAKVEERFSQRRDEIGTLARDFNHMASELKAQIQAKEVLLRDISHELRSPLGRIQIALGLAALDQANVEVQHRRIERDIERMNTLIEEIIRLARLTSVPQSFPMEEVDLGVLLDEVADDVSPEATVFGRCIVVTCPAHLIVRGNRELLRRAVENVLRNANRYSPENSEITVSARAEEKAVAIHIRDHGPGVPANDLARIFEPFYRISRAREREGGGTGLGLAITARVMALHSGQVFASDHPDGGLVVTLRLPAAVFPTAEIAAPAKTISEPGTVGPALDLPI
jgi:two-component system sensor histidine kinase CpxA